MLILGIGGFMHDYNCALIDLQDNRIAMCEAERLSRRKHHVASLDEDIMQPVDFCLKKLGRRKRDISVVVMAHTDPFPIKDALKKKLKKARFVEVDHHLSHAAGAFFASGLEDAVILSLDGFGDGSSGVLAYGNGNRVDVLERISDANSIGLEYLRATYHIGLGGYGSEGKTQGLAPYGEPTLFDAYMQHINITASGNLELSDALRGEDSILAGEGGYVNAQMLNNDFLNEHVRRRIPPEKLTDTHLNLAASIQKVLEHIGIELARIGQQKTGSRNLVVSGGVSMNSSMNGELLRSGLFDHVFALPMASDRGLGISAALYYAHIEAGARDVLTMEHVFYGGEYTDKDAIKAMKKAGLNPHKVDDVASVAADAIAEGKIIGWMQGASEVGARALGHRSILADPRKAEMKDIVNERIKHREWFRPFAPAVLDTNAATYFEIPETSADLSHMTYTLKTTERANQSVPAIVHVDHTARVQVVPHNSQINAGYARILSYFEQLTGEGVILNTSFNDKGEPIVETPQDAVNTFLACDMDLLCIGNIVGKRP